MENVPMISEVTGPRASFPIEHDIAPRAPMLWLLVCGLALMVAIAVATVLSIDKFRENAIENGKDGLESAVLLLVRHFDQQFGDFSIPQKLIIAELESSGITSPDIFRGEMATLAVHEKLRAKVDGGRTWPAPMCSTAKASSSIHPGSGPSRRSPSPIAPTS